MKLRIRGNTIRFRLTQSEVAMLGSGQAVSETTPFSIYEKLVYSLETWNLDVVEPRFEAGQLRVMCPISVVSSWATSSEEGFSASHDTGTGELLEISVEKDFPCAHRDGAEERDQFPRPQSGEVKC